MKNTILHGENHAASRDELTSTIESFKQKGCEVIHLDSPTTTELLNAGTAQGLFSSNQLVVVENFVSSSKEAPDILLGIKSPLLVWEKKTLLPSIIKKLSANFLMQEFKLPSVLFTLLDNIAPNSEKRLLTLFEEGKTQVDTEFLFIMLARQVRLLLWATLAPETLAVPSWQKGKLVSQAGKFVPEQLLSLHAKLLGLDRDNKTSKLPENLSSSLELLFASL